jgi:dihydroflavonol-4-reductase
VLPVAYAAEAVARVFRTREPIVSVDAVRMSKKVMFFSSARAMAELGYRPRPAIAALEDAVRWFRDNGYID